MSLKSGKLTVPLRFMGSSDNYTESSIIFSWCTNGLYM